MVLPSRVKIDAAIYEKYAPRPEIQEQTVLVEVKEEKKPVAEEPPHRDLAFDPMDIPTLSHQDIQTEIKTKSKTKGVEPESLNDRLRQGKMELAETLKEAPIRDLRKAIGINDRFLFINDLFRGDEPMYERSIKTINSFNIFAEAEYWISRELKVKLGWDVEDPIVVQFDQLIRRRFL